MAVAAFRAAFFALPAGTAFRVLLPIFVLGFAGSPAPVRAQDASEPAPLAHRALLLDVARAGDSFVAVGDHGDIVVSRDQGKTWTQSPAPTRALLTGVSFPDPQHGWAVGHDGVILATADGGRTWQRQDDGADLETVYLDVLFLDAARGFAVGAYGKFMTTGDGGRTWTAARPSEEESHFNRISAGADGWLYLAGESGTLLLSDDQGKNWKSAAVPYEGSLFGALPLENGAVIVYGLRGHILRSDDHGANWVPKDSAVRVLIMGGTRLADRVILLGGQGGNFFLSRDAGRSFQPWKPADFSSSIADLIATDDGGVLVVGEAGATRIRLP